MSQAAQAGINYVFVGLRHRLYEARALSSYQNILVGWNEILTAFHINLRAEKTET